MWFGDRWYLAAGVGIKNFEFFNGARSCIRIFSECNYQGAHKDVCGDNPNLKDSGWNYVIKSVEIPKGYDKTVTLWTEVNYKAKKVVLTKSAPCIAEGHYSLI